MGIIHKGIPQQLALKLKESYDLTTFVETGTLIGRTTEWAAQRFDTVYSIEASKKFYEQTKKRLSIYDQVRLFHGLSQDILPRIIRNLIEPAMFWLDAHWSKDLHYARPDIVCPVLNEISTILEYDDGHIILVDDHRLFGDEQDWPTAEEVILALTSNSGRIVNIVEDVFVSEPL